MFDIYYFTTLAVREMLSHILMLCLYQNIQMQLVGINTKRYSERLKKQAMFYNLESKCCFKMKYLGYYETFVFPTWVIGHIFLPISSFAKSQVFSSFMLLMKITTELKHVGKPSCPSWNIFWEIDLSGLYVLSVKFITHKCQFQTWKNILAA